MKVAIIFPAKAHKPIGGYKIALEYANRLALDGYEVQLLYPIHIRGRRNVQQKFYDFLRYIRFRNRFSVSDWFDLNQAIKETVLPNFRELPDADIYICTSVETAIAWNSAVKNDKARSFYFIQNFENWNVSTEELLETYHYPFTKIAISPYLVDAVVREGQECHYAPNGFDHSEYRMVTPIEEKEAATVSILYHTQESKDFKTGLEALKAVHNKHPELKALVFGAYECKEDLPDWCEFFHNPDKATHNLINNRAAIYLGPSRLEGFCLTIGEAMMCGQAVVCTDIPGYTVLARNNETALVSPIGNAQALADNIVRLIENQQERIRLARAGHDFIADYTYEKAYARFKEIIESQISDSPQA